MLENKLNEDIEFKAKDGVKLAATLRGKKGSDKSAIVLPGFLANREAYFDIADSLDDYLCLVLSLRGQGSEGEFSPYKITDDIILVSQALKSDYGAKKIGVVAHSGSDISSIIAAVKDEIDSLCLLNAMLQFSEPDGFLLNSLYKGLLHTFGFLPKSVSRNIINSFNYPISRISSKYKDLSFRIYKEKIDKKEDIFIAGLRVSNVKEFVRNCLHGPSALDYVADLDKPVLYLYGGEDILIGFRKNKVPWKYRELISLTGVNKCNEEVYSAVVNGADWSFNEVTLPDDPLNYSPELQYVKALMKDFLDMSLGEGKIELGLRPKELKSISSYPL